MGYCVWKKVVWQGDNMNKGNLYAAPDFDFQALPAHEYLSHTYILPEAQ